MVEDSVEFRRMLKWAAAAPPPPDGFDMWVSSEDGALRFIPTGADVVVCDKDG